MKYLLYTIMGYLSGSVLYASLVPRYFHHVDIRKVSDDGNPGTANVFKYVGFGAGCLVICMELLKAFIPVFVAAHRVDVSRLPFAFIMAAPVLGHAFPFLYVLECLMRSGSHQAQAHFSGRLTEQKGGKAIAASFGVVLALFPELYPFAALAFFYILFSTVIVIKPHLFRSILTFFLFSLTVFFKVPIASVRLGCFLISVITIYKHVICYQQEHLEVKLFSHFNLIR